MVVIKLVLWVYLTQRCRTTNRQVLDMPPLHDSNTIFSL